MVRLLSLPLACLLGLTLAVPAAAQSFTPPPKLDERSVVFAVDDDDDDGPPPASRPSPASLDLDERPARRGIGLGPGRLGELPRPDDPRHVLEAGADLRLRLELPRFGWEHARRGEFLHQVTLTRLPAGALVVRYAGVHDFVVRRVTQRLHSAWTDTLDQLWKAGTLDDVELRQAVRDMNDALADQRSGGRWWERDWWDYLPPEKGGAPRPAQYVVGDRHAVLTLGPLAISNDFKGRVQGLTLSLAPDSERIVRGGAVAHRLGLARDDARVARSDDGDEVVAVSRDADEPQRDAPLLRLFVDGPDEAGGLLAGTGWRLRLRPAVRVNLTEDPTRALRDVSLRLQCDWSRHDGEPAMIQLEALVRFEPKDQDVRAGVQLTFLFF